MAGEIDNDLRIKAFNNGVHDFFEKPVNKLEALQKIHNLISMKKASAKLIELNAKLYPLRGEDSRIESLSKLSDLQIRI